METVADIFIVSRSDLLHPRWYTFEENGKTYDCLRHILQELTTKQPIHIFDKQRLKMESIYESDTETLMLK